MICHMPLNIQVTKLNSPTDVTRGPLRFASDRTLKKIDLYNRWITLDMVGKDQRIEFTPSKKNKKSFKVVSQKKI